MDISFQQGPNGRLILSPESREALLQQHPWAWHFAYHDMCRQMYRQANPDAVERPAPPIAEQGYQKFTQLISPEEVAVLEGLLSGYVEGPDKETDGSEAWHAVLPWNMARIHAARQVVSTIFNGPLGKTLEGYFGSYFRLMSLSLVRGFPGKAQGSFMWHRDFEPPQQTHLMVYLTDSSEESGGTSFLNIEETKIAAEGGIHFQSGDDERPDTIEKIEAKVGRKLHPYRPELKAGDGILFGAPRILHQGNLPKSGWRDTLVLLVLPSPVPWDEYLAKDTRDFFVTQHPGASFIEPFAGQVLPIRSSHAVLNWAAMGSMFPPGYDG